MSIYCIVDYRQWIIRIRLSFVAHGRREIVVACSDLSHVTGAEGILSPGHTYIWGGRGEFVCVISFVSGGGLRGGRRFYKEKSQLDSGLRPQ